MTQSGTVPTGLPPGLVHYRSTPVFTESTVPARLMRTHQTAPGVWGAIRVIEGRLLYRVLDPRSERILSPFNMPGLAPPCVPHQVAPLGPTRFQIDFYRNAPP